MNAHIASIAYYLPEAIVSNEDLARQNPAWDLKGVQEKSGVTSRHIAAPGETALDLAKKACERLFQGGAAKESIDGIIFCTQSPDYIMPQNSHLLHSHLALPDEVLAFDFNLACSGYVYGLALAQSLIGSGIARGILLVTADTYSKYINPKDRSARVLFGDGAAVTLLSSVDGPAELKGFELWSRGSGFDKFFIPCGGHRRPKSSETLAETTDRSGNVRSPENIHMDGLAVWSFINSAVPRQIRTLLSKNGLQLSDIDLFVFHQASKMTLDSLVKLLGIGPDKVVVNFATVGNTVSASIPIVLKDSLDSGRLHKGQRVLLAGFGVGLSYGAALWEYRGQ